MYAVQTPMNVRFCHIFSRNTLLAPLTRIAYIKRKIQWTQVKQGAFGEINLIMARDTL